MNGVWKTGDCCLYTHVREIVSIRGLVLQTAWLPTPNNHQLQALSETRGTIQSIRGGVPSRISAGTTSTWKIRRLFLSPI